MLINVIYTHALVKGTHKFFKIHFNWKLITLKYCGGFRHTLT